MNVSNLSHSGGNRAHRELAIQAQIEAELGRGLHGACGLGPYGCLIVATGPEGGVIRNVERVHDIRWLLKSASGRCENAGKRKSGCGGKQCGGCGRRFLTWGTGVSSEARLRVWTSTVHGQARSYVDSMRSRRRL